MIFINKIIMIKYKKLEISSKKWNKKLRNSEFQIYRNFKFLDKKFYLMEIKNIILQQFVILQIFLFIKLKKKLFYNFQKWFKLYW